MEERLQKILSAHGVSSRRAAEGYLSAGRVTVNGCTARVGDKADPETDTIALDGVPVGRGSALHDPASPLLVGRLSADDEVTDQRCASLKSRQFSLL